MNNDVIEHIKKYDPSDKTTIRESEEVFRSESLLNDFNSFVLVSEKDDLPELHTSAFQVTILGKLHERLPLVFTKFVKRKSSEAAPPA